MSAIGPGDWVECIARTGRPDLCVPGGLYCVEALVPAFGTCPACEDGSDIEGMIFVGQPKERNDTGQYWSWCPCRFRPVYRPKADLIESLKAPPVRVGEFA